MSSALAGETLAQITNHRYGKVEIDESFKASIYDDDKTKPVISGGEEDVLALALRVALSRYILDKSGMPASMLVMDEVFGSLDSDRRANVMEMFDGLGEIFPQIILISHVELPNQGNRVLQVEYDTSDKQSTVSEFTSHLVSL
jgi:exonuclease SbcC